jgi:hypothetical protein
MEICSLEKRLLEVKTSFERQLSLFGKPGYDPSLTMNLKKDYAWLEEQKKSETVQKLFSKRENKY